MLPESEAPELPGLEELREHVKERGLEVRRIYYPGSDFTDEHGETTYIEPSWDTVLVKEAKAEDGKLYVHAMTLSDQMVARGVEFAEYWDHFATMVEEGFEKVLEEHGARDEG